MARPLAMNVSANVSIELGSIRSRWATSTSSSSGEDLAGAGDIAHRDGDSCARRAKRPCRLEADAHRAAGDDRGPAREVDAFNDLGGGACRAEARADEVLASRQSPARLASTSR